MPFGQVVRIRVDLNRALLDAVFPDGVPLSAKVALTWPYPTPSTDSLSLDTSGTGDKALSLVLPEPLSAELTATLKLTDGKIISATQTIPPNEDLRSDFQDLIASRHPVIGPKQRVRVVEGKYTLTRSLVIERGGTLILDPGVQLLFGPKASIYCGGTLIAQGTKEKPIHMVPEDPDEAWGGVFLNGPYASGSQLVYCVFENARGTRVTVDRGFVQHNDRDKSSKRYGGALLIANGGREPGRVVQLSHLLFSKNSADDGGGLAVFNGSVRIEHSDFEKNHAEENGGGLYANNATVTFGEGVSFKDNKADKFGGGVLAMHRSDFQTSHPVGFQNNEASIEAPDVFLFRVTLSDRKHWPDDAFVQDSV